MKKMLSILVTFFAIIFFFSQTNAETTNNLEPSVTQQIISKAKNNDNWKMAFITGKNAQVVFMNISPITNPKNEIGVEGHFFDQIILVVSGSGIAVLNGKKIAANTGDMIFIPKGTQHNIINSNTKSPLKIISIYSNTDIPANSIYKKKIDEPMKVAN